LAIREGERRTSPRTLLAFVVLMESGISDHAGWRLHWESRHRVLPLHATECAD